MIHLGRWQDALAHVDEVDTLICDPPYGAKTHASDRVNERRDDAEHNRLDYSSFSVDDVDQFVDHWSPRVHGWFCVLSCHLLASVWQDALEDAGRYVFAPVPIISKRVRLAGDGPSSWAVYLTVARPRREPFSKWGTLPGAYFCEVEKNGAAVIGAKPLSLMRAIVADYSKPGDLIVDPCAGSGTTLLSARTLGRRAIGAEMDPKTHAYALARISRPHDVDMFSVADRYKDVDMFKGE